MGKLVLYLPDGSVHDIALDKERITIGRRADNDVCLPFPAVSGEHASVVTILADSFLEDQGSTNGTLVNGKPIVKHFLRDQDVIDIGRQRLVYLADESGEAQPLAPDVLLRSVRELDEQVARVRSTRTNARAGGGRGAAGSGDGHGRASSSPKDSEAAKAGRTGIEATIPPRSEGDNGTPLDDDAIARDFANVFLGEGQDQEGNQERQGRAGASGASAESKAGAPALGYGERSHDLGALIEARRHRNPSARRGGENAESTASDTGSATSATGTAVGHVVSTREQAAERSSGPGQANERPDQKVSPTPHVKVVSGPNSGRQIALSKDLLTIGRIGLQVAAIRRVGAGWQLESIEGHAPPLLNGAPLPPGGAAVKVGDAFTVAGTELVLAVA